MKKVLSAISAICLIFSLSSPAYAMDSLPVAPEPPADYGEPIQETTYYDEELDAKVVERVYFVPNGAATFDGKSGEGWYKNEKSHYFNGGITTTTYARGYFVWGNGDVSVSRPESGYDVLPSHCSITQEDTTSGTGNYAWVFNKFAYVTYTLKVKTQFGGAQDLSVTIRLSESGNMI